MKYTCTFLFLLFSCFSFGQTQFQDGDILFQTTSSAQSKAIQLATASKYSHVGILFEEADGWYVYEAVQPVRKVPLQQWVRQGNNKHYSIKRYKYSITTSKRDSMLVYVRSQLGKDYDPYFNWSDEQIYCSELVWKAFHYVKIDLCTLRKLKEYQLDHPIVAKKLKERYGHKIPYEELMVSPSDLENSKFVKQIN